MFSNTIQTVFTLFRLKPDAIIIIKSLPQNVLATMIYSLFRSRKSLTIILDIDDFELTANVLTSLTQRAAIHAAERIGARLADHIVTATPFLSDHFEQLTQGKKKITMILTGVTPPSPSALLDGEGEPEGVETRTSILYLGSISISSGHRVDLLPDILTAVRQEIPDVTLTIAGDGHDVAKLKSAFEQAGLSEHIAWHGRFSTDEVPGLLANHAVLVDPVDSSINNRAKSSYRAALAASAGHAIVSSDVGIRPYLLPASLHDKLLAQPADINDFANKIIGLIKKPLTAAEANQLTKHAQQHNWYTLAKKYQTIISN